MSLLVVTDLLVVVGCALLVQAPWYVAFVFALLLVLSLRATYRLGLALSALSQVVEFTRAGGISLLVSSPLLVVWDETRAGVLLAVATTALLPFTRAACYAIVRRWRRKGRLTLPTVIIGGGQIGLDLIDIMLTQPSLGLDPIGIVDEDSRPSVVPHLGRVTDLSRLVREHDVGAVIIAYGLTRSADLVSVLRSLGPSQVDVYAVPRFFEVGLAPRHSASDDAGGLPLLRVRRAAMTRPAAAVKRTMDVLVSAVLLCVLAPLILVVAGLVRFSGPGPILFRQSRVGRNGRPFTVLKFRTLKVAEPIGGVRDAEDAQAAHARREQDASSRATPVGRFLRRSSLDELPQLWNVLTGDMSLVGPRPEEVDLAVGFGSLLTGYTDRHRLPVGITGWAQIHGFRGDTSLRARIRLDNDYIENWSLGRDLIILARTGAAVARSTIRGKPRSDLTIREASEPTAPPDPVPPEALRSPSP